MAIVSSCLFLLPRHKGKHRHGQDGVDDGHADVDEGLGAVGEEHEHGGVVHGPGLGTPPPGLQEAEAEPEVGQEAGDADGHQVVQVLVVGAVEHAVARVHHVLEVVVHGDHVVGIRAVAEELLEEGHVVHEIGEGHAPGEAAACAPLIVKVQEAAEGLPERCVVAAVGVHKDADDHSDAQNDQACPEAFRKLCQRLSHCPPGQEAADQQHGDQHQDREPECTIASQGDEDAVVLSHIDRPERRGVDHDAAEAHGQQGDQQANAVTQHMTALLPEQKGRCCIEHAVGEDRIVAHAADQGLVGDAEGRQREEPLRQLFRPDKKAHGDRQKERQVTGIGVDVADAGGEDAPIGSVRDLIKEAEDI